MSNYDGKLSTRNAFTAGAKATQLTVKSKFARMENSYIRCFRPQCLDTTDPSSLRHLDSEKLTPLEPKRTARGEVVAGLQNLSQ